VGYAVGEMCAPNSDDDEEEENRWHPTIWNTYEVVTAWVHPRSVLVGCSMPYQFFSYFSFRGLNLAVKMYFDISLQGVVVKISGQSRREG